MSNKRGKRGGSSHKLSIIPLVIRDATINLCNVLSDKPTINSMMPIIEKRLSEEQRLKLLEIGRRWKRGGWSDGMLYNCMGEEDYIDEYGYDPYEEIYSSLSSKERKRLNKKLFKQEKKDKKKNRKSPMYTTYDEDDDYWNNRHSMFTNGEWSDEEDNYDDSYKCIKFYPDIENELDVHEFYSLKEFNDFCVEHEYNIGNIDRSNLMNWSVVHCCLDPISLEYGENDIITDNSYGGLYWTVSEDITKSDALSHEPHYENDDDEVRIVGGVADVRNFTN